MKILLVSYAFPPVSSPGAIRIERFAHYLAASGHAVTVLTCSNAYSSMTSSQSDPSDSRLGYKVIRARDLVDKTSYSGTSRSARKQTLKGSIATFLASMFYPDRNVTWAPMALSAVQRLPRDFDFVLGTYPGASNLLVAAYAGKRLKGRLVLDYRDLWTDSDPNKRRSWIRRACDRFLENRLLKRSALVLTVNQFDAQVMRRRTPEGIDVETVYNGHELDMPATFDDQLCGTEGQISTKKYSIAYAGSFYGGERDPSALFAAVSALSREGALTRDVFTINIYGNREAEVERCAAANGIHDLVVFHPMLDRRRLFQELAGSSLLLALTRKGSASAGELTTKLFEYIGLGGEILCLTKPGFEVERVLKVVEGATCIDVDDVSAIADFLRTELQDWGCRGKTQRRYSRPETYTRQASARKLECALQKLL